MLVRQMTPMKGYNRSSVWCCTGLQFTLYGYRLQRGSAMGLQGRYRPLRPSPRKTRTPRCGQLLTQLTQTHLVAPASRFFPTLQIVDEGPTIPDKGGRGNPEVFARFRFVSELSKSSRYRIPCDFVRQYLVSQARLSREGACILN